MFNKRSASTVNGTPNARYTKARAVNVQGVILFPDNYVHPSGVTQPVGINETGNLGWNENDYSAADLGLMEQNGAVFLPAAGSRSGSSFYNVGSFGNYWSASCNNSSSAWYVYFGNSSLGIDYDYIRYYGRSVRLVLSLQ